ncbi:MAG: PPA1309 family protein [Nocardioidaceae bacterium]
MPETNELSPEALGLRMAIVEVEQHASRAGWDQAARLFALVPTAELVAAEPTLAAEIGIADGSDTLYTPVEQDLDEHDSSLEELLGSIVWPTEVAGALAVVERLVLPPAAETQLPDDATAAAAYAAEHEQREDVRIAVGVLRSGEAHCVVRVRSHDSDDALLHGPEVVPALVLALRETLEADD